MEIAKHRLFYSLLRLGLPVTTRQEDPEGLAFDFLVAPPGGPVMTGHAGGLITINVAEADDVGARAPALSISTSPIARCSAISATRSRTTTGTIWCATAPSHEQFRALFGDETQDYNAALQSYYANGPAPDWPERFVSGYASSHPWEDFAETWAHYFHMVDTLETANAFGLRVRPRVAQGADLATAVDFDPMPPPWTASSSRGSPMTVAINAINRSMGIPDLYPFVLAPPAIVKLTFVHDCIHEAGIALESEGGFRRFMARFKRKPAPAG